MQNPEKKHVLHPRAAPAGYGDPSQGNLTNTGENQPSIVGKAMGKAMTNAGANGGSELGSIVGGALGPPIIGSYIGSLVGEKVGEKVINETGLNEFATRTGDKLSDVIGRNNVKKMHEITLSALEYSETEECVCCPCLPASQVLLFLTVPFFLFNCYTLGLGVSYNSDCSKIAPDKNYTFNSTDDIPDIYPCVFGFHYLVVSGAVWIALLPFWIFTLFGKCWRQSCGCCCDPVVLCSTVVELLQRCCCECGNFKFCEVLWMIHCLFHMIWSVLALAWVIGLQLDQPILELKDQIEVPGWSVPKLVSNTVIVSIVLDFVLAGSELFNRICAKFRVHGRQ